MTLLLLGANARWITACARLIATSGRPTYSTARAAASAVTSACGSARPMSSLARMTRRAEAVLTPSGEASARGDNRPSPPPSHQAREPVQAGVGIGAADRLDERG